MSINTTLDLLNMFIILLSILHILALCEEVPTAGECHIGDHTLHKFSYPSSEEINRALITRPIKSWGINIRKQKSIRMMILGFMINYLINA